MSLPHAAAVLYTGSLRSCHPNILLHPLQEMIWSFSINDRKRMPSCDAYLHLVLQRCSQIAKEGEEMRAVAN